MRIQEPETFPADTDTIITPVYRVDFWSLEEGLVVNCFQVHDARDVLEVEAWARDQRHSQYIIYCEVPAPQGLVQYVRVSGYEPFITNDPVEHFLSDPADVERVQQRLDAWPPSADVLDSPVRYTAEAHDDTP